MRSFLYTRRGDVITYRATRLGPNWWRITWQDGHHRCSAIYAHAAVTAYLENNTWRRIDITITKR